MERGNEWEGGEQRTCSLYLDTVSLKFLSTLRDYQILNLVISEPLLSTKHLAHGLGEAVQIQTTLCSFKIRIGKGELIGGRQKLAGVTPSLKKMSY